MKTLAFLLLLGGVSQAQDIMNDLLANPRCSSARENMTAAQQTCSSNYTASRQACQTDYDVCRRYNSHGNCNDRRQKCYERAEKDSSRCRDAAERAFKDACIAVVMNPDSGNTTASNTGDSTGGTTGGTTGTTTGNAAACNPETHFQNQTAKCQREFEQDQVRCQQDFDSCRSRHGHGTCNDRRTSCRQRATYRKQGCTQNAAIVRQLGTCADYPPAPPPEDPPPGSEGVQ